MIRHIWLFTAFALAALVAPSFTSAGGDKKEPVVKTPNYYPLQVGNRWDYDLTANGNTVPMSTTIARSETIDGVPLAVLEMSMQGKMVASEHLRQTDKGLVRYRSGQFVPTPPFVMVKYPIKSGDKWDGSFKVGEAKANYSSEAEEETIEVPAGKYKTMRVAIKIEENGNVVKTTYWFAENVGFVKQTIEAANVDVVVELRKFEPKVEAPK